MAARRFCCPAWCTTCPGRPWPTGLAVVERRRRQADGRRTRAAGHKCDCTRCACRICRRWRHHHLKSLDESRRSVLAGHGCKGCAHWRRVQLVAALLQRVVPTRPSLSRLRCVRIANLLRQFRYVPRPTGATEAVVARCRRPISAATVGSWKRKRAMTAAAHHAYLESRGVTPGRRRPHFSLRRLLQAVAAAADGVDGESAFFLFICGGRRYSMRGRGPHEYCSEPRSTRQPRPRQTATAPGSHTRQPRLRRPGNPFCYMRTASTTGARATRRCCGVARRQASRPELRHTRWSSSTRWQRRDLRRCRSGSRPERCQGPHDRCNTAPSQNEARP